jgi:predicted AlkP superfamily pyrophosphatase or phosphodiesterase
MARHEGGTDELMPEKQLFKAPIRLEYCGYETCLQGSRAMRHIVLSFLLAVFLAACATVQQPASAPEPATRTVLLVGIDGFRADYLDRGITPVLSKLATEGARAKAMRPSFPTVTFPNHYTLVTGLRPDQHGIVNNTMIDPAIPGDVFRLSDRKVLADPRWWNGGEPIWVTAEKAGLPTATLFWPGSEVEIRGQRPGTWLPYDEKMPYATRVDTVLGWLDRPQGQRPRFMTLYFESVDTEGHNGGPDSAAVNKALGDVDAALGQLVDGLAARKLDTRIDLIIVSDHGMAATSDTRAIDLDAFVDRKSMRVAWMSRPYVALEPSPEFTAAQAAQLLKRHERFECWKKENIPARLKFGAHPRVPPIFCLADNGWVFTSSSRPERYPLTGGAHGYDPAAPDMDGLFVAHGPSFRPGARLPAFDNVDVHPLMMHLLGLGAVAKGAVPETVRPALAR